MSTYKETTLERIEFADPLIDDGGVPLVIDDWTLAFRLGFTGKALWYVTRHRDSLYRVFLIKKASGGMRTIHDPQPIMRLMAKQIRTRILMPLCKRLGSHVSAYQVGKSTKDAAKMHILECPVCAHLDQPHTCKIEFDGKDKQYHVTRSDADTCAACQPVPKHKCPRRGVKIHMDLKDFFTSTRRSWIRKYFHEEVGYNHYVSGLLAQMLTVTFEDKKRKIKFAGVPQGSPASGDITNLVADWRLDRYLIRALPGWTYTRYADDLYFSHPENLKRPEVDKVVNEITRLVQRAGYVVNRKKLHVQRPNRRQRILGITVNQKAGMPRDTYRKLRSLLHNCILYGFESQTKKAGKERAELLVGWLSGQIAYLQVIDPDKSRRLKMMFNHAKWLHEGEIVREIFGDKHAITKESA